MTTITTQFNPEELAAIDELVQAGVAETRSDVVLLAVAQLHDRHRRSAGAGIADSYKSSPQPRKTTTWRRRTPTPVTVSVST